MIDQLVRDGYAVLVVCEVLDYARSTYYHTAKPTPDDALRAAIREVAGQWPRYGYRRVTAQLRRQGWSVNRKRTLRRRRRVRPASLPKSASASVAGGARRTMRATCHQRSSIHVNRPKLMKLDPTRNHSRRR